MDHDEGGLIRYNFDGKDGALIITGEFNYWGTTETFDPITEQWGYRGQTEDLRYIYGFASVNIDNNVYIFGGKLYSSDYQDKIRKMDRNRLRIDWI